MALGYPTTSGTYESQQFGPVPYGVPGYYSQPAMYASGSSVAWWQPYRGWTRYEHYHNGLDVAGPDGLALRALESGTVIFAGWATNGGGWVVAVEIRPGTRYTFNHCEELRVRSGDKVSRSQIIATIGASGTATGSHCHVSLDIAEKGADGIIRQLVYNPRHFMAGGPLQYDPRITPLPISVPPPAGDDDVYSWIPKMKHQKPKPVVVRKGAIPLSNPDGTAHSPGYSFPSDTKLEVIGGLTSNGQFWSSRRYGGPGLFLIRDSDVVRWP